MAKKFNEVYPGNKINVWSKIGDPDQYNTSVMGAGNGKLSGKVWKISGCMGINRRNRGYKEEGLVADLSVYKDDETYKKYNESLMKSINYDGFLGGPPSYTIPGGIWVNKALAQDNNINVPKPD